jgi:nucleotide-binding universal stress UspA family protein
MDITSSSATRLPVVVGVDGTRNAGVTIDVAVAQAASRHASLLVVHAWPGHYRGRARSSEDGGRDLLTAAANRARAARPGLDVGTELLPGRAADVLAHCSERAGLLVVGHRDRGAGRLEWGSTAVHLAHHCACPLVVHRGQVADKGPVVVGVSGHSAEPAALGFAFAEAARSEVPLVAIHVLDRPLARTGRETTLLLGPTAPGWLDAEHILAEALAGWAPRYAAVPVQPIIIPPLDLAYTVERASRRGRLLVVGTGGNGGLTQLNQAADGHAAVRRARCAVAIVPPAWRPDPNSPALTSAMGDEGLGG